MKRRGKRRIDAKFTRATFGRMGNSGFHNGRYIIRLVSERNGRGYLLRELKEAVNRILNRVIYAGMSIGPARPELEREKLVLNEKSAAAVKPVHPFKEMFELALDFLSNRSNSGNPEIWKRAIPLCGGSSPAIWFIRGMRGFEARKPPAFLRLWRGFRAAKR